MVATLPTSSRPSTARAVWRSRSCTAIAAASMPRLSCIGSAPAATLRIPARTIAWASTVAVVVPSPATSLVLVATSLASCAPRFSYGSSSSISLAIVTPSLVMVGTPQDLSMTTLRPRGPSVTLTASASLSTPRSRALTGRVVELQDLGHARRSLFRLLGCDCLFGRGRCRPGLRSTHPRRRPGDRTGRPPGAASSGCWGQWPAAHFSMTASTSRAERMRYSSPANLTSVPPYLL